MAPAAPPDTSHGAGVPLNLLVADDNPPIRVSELNAELAIVTTPAAAEPGAPAAAAVA